MSVSPSVLCKHTTRIPSAWWGFTTAADRQRLEAAICRGVRSGLCDPNQLTLNELIDNIDDKLFFQEQLSHLKQSSTERNSSNFLGSTDIT